MSLFFRSAASEPEARAISSLPWASGGESPLAMSSMEGQLGLVPVYAATRLIADAVSSLPLQAFRKTMDGRTPIKMPAVFESPANRGTRVDWLGRCMMSLLLRGNAYGLIVGNDLDTPGMPKMIEWLNPDKVHLDNGRWTYEGREVSASKILHIPAMVVPGQTLGMSPLGACSATMSTGQETQRFMRDWYRNRAVPGLVFRNSERTLDAATATAAKDRLKATLRAGEPFVTGKDWSLDILKLTADDAGFISTSRLTATQVANIYGVPPEMIGGETGASMTYSTTEQQQIQFITHTLRPWLVRLEAAFSSLMPNPQYVKFNVDALIRVDTKTRYDVHRIGREIGLVNIDELRKLEDMEPLPDGQGQDYAPLAVKPQPPKETA